MSASPVIKSSSKTVTDTLVGEHQHQIVGYSLIKGIGDGEPIASERFTVGGHEWVLLLYPDGKRSSSAEGHLQGNAGGGDHANIQMPPAAQVHQLQAVAPPAPAGAGAEGEPAPAGQMVAAAAAAANINAPALRLPNNQVQNNINMNNRRDTTNEYAALFVALIGEGSNPQGVVNTSEGKVVRAFHRFTLVDQTGQGRDLTKGRTRDAGAVKISCARLDPNARNCHGYRKFVKRSILEDPSRGYLVNDTIIIKYTIELVVSSGGALSRGNANTSGVRSELVRVPPSTLGSDLAALYAGGQGTDFQFIVEGQTFKAHKIVLQARSPYLSGLVNSDMKECKECKSVVDDVKPPVFAALLHFVYTDSLPEEYEGNSLDVPMAQHLLAAADKYQLVRLRRICERRLCDTVDVETVGTTLALAEQNHAEELKKVCLDFISRNLAAVMTTDGYKHMTASCPNLVAEILSTIAVSGPQAAGGTSSTLAEQRGGSLLPGGGAILASGTAAAGHRTVRLREHATAPDEEVNRRVRQRRD